MTAAAETDITHSVDSGTDSEDNELRSNLDMDHKDPKPSKKWCSYCGIHNSFKGLMQCPFPECVRQMSRLCVMRNLQKHNKHLAKCTHWIP